MTSGAYCFLVLILMLLAKWVHHDISVGNIILVKDEDSEWTRRISDLEYAWEFDSTPRGHKDPKTVISISRYATFVVTKFPQSTLFFMSWKVHSRQRLRDKPISFDIRYSIFHALGSPFMPEADKSCPTQPQCLSSPIR